MYSLQCAVKFSSLCLRMHLIGARIVSRLRHYADDTLTAPISLKILLVTRRQKYREQKKKDD